MIRSPQRSTTKLAAVLGLSCNNIRRILYTNCNFLTYKTVVVEELTDCDKANGKVFCSNFLTY